MIVAVPGLPQENVLWFLNRGSGVVLLAVLTLSTVLGMSATSRTTGRRWPRYATQSLHRSVSLLSLALLVVHAGTAVLDTYVTGFVTITPLDAVVPFVGSYRPVWLGLGTLSLDLLLAVTLTSLLRHRMGHGSWRAVHLASYLAWALAVVHGFFIGTDSGTGWGLGVTVASVAVVLVMGGARLVALRAERAIDA